MAEIADNWITTAERLREIRKARDSFLLRWAADVLEGNPGGFDELSDALAREMIDNLAVTSRKSRLFGSGVLDD